MTLTLLLLAATLALSSAAGNAAQPSRPVHLAGGDPLARLRAEYRLDAPPVVTREGLPRRTALIWLFLVAASTLAVAIPAVQSKRPLRLAQVGVPFPEGGVQVRKFTDRKVDLGAQAEVPGGETEEEERGPLGAGEQTTGDERHERDEGAVAQPATFAEVGEHVASVLEAARQAAERIRSEAHGEATGIRERSQKEAEAAVTDARRKAEELTAQANEAQAEARGAAKEIRARADAYAERRRGEADEAAAGTVARAERHAKEWAAAAQERQQTLDENVARTEERLRKLVTGLRELAGRLDVLVGPERVTDAAGRRPQAEDGRGLDDSLRQRASEHTPEEEAEQEEAVAETEAPKA